MVSLRSLTPDLQAETERIRAVRGIRPVVLGIVEEANRRMSVLEKIAEVRRRRADLTKSLDEGGQKLLERYDEIEKQKDTAFLRHHQQLDAEVSELRELDAAVAMLSNNLGNSSNA